MSVAVFDGRQCALGEGPLWHPVRGELLWFDIIGKKLLSKGQEWEFEEYVSAAGWVDQNRVLMASETSLSVYDLRDGSKVHVCDLEADKPMTRSNDGRADPQGGFWIGTMGKETEPKAGAIYRWFCGELRQLFSEITISNSICFSPDKTTAYFTDTSSKKIMHVALNRDGWPIGKPAIFVDLTAEQLNPDGSVVDAAGCLWNAQWGAHRVAKYGPDGRFLEAVSFPAAQVSCPAFGGADLRTLYTTSAADGFYGPDEGKTYCVRMGTVGQAEHRVIL